MILVTLVLIFCVYFFTLVYKQWKVYNYLVSNFTSPPRRFLVGSLYLFPLSSPPGIFKAQQDILQEYGKNVVLTKPILDATLLISDRKDIEKILSDANTRKAKKSFIYEQTAEWLGTGLLTAYGEKWYTRRKIITPSFHFSILDGFVGIMSHEADLLIQHLERYLGQGEVDIYPIINAFALDVICETSIGVRLNAQNNPFSDYVTSVKKATVGLQKKFLHPLSRINFLYNMTNDGKKLKNLFKSLHDFTDKVIQERRAQLKSNDEQTTKGARGNFLELLLNATVDGNPLSNEDIREEVDTFMFAGHDTTASGISFVLYLLSKHPDVQERLYQELVDVFGVKSKVEITNKTLSELTYLDMVVKESLRILPPVPNFGRQLLEDTVIGDVNVPAGVNISCSIYRMHHDPDNFPDPEKFDPDRFSPLGPQKMLPYSYIPFSAGGRNCIGQKFAILDIKTSISKILMNFRVSTTHQLLLQSDIVLKSSNGVFMKLDKR